MNKKAILIGAGALVLILVGGYIYFAKPADTGAPVLQETIQQTPETANSDQKTLQVSSDSKATYEIDEVLNGKPTHVTGTTSAITGSVALDTKTPQSFQIGEVKIDARTFKTDIEMRDNNVRKLVLKADEAGNEFVVFKTTSITGRGDAMELNKDLPVTINGDITIAGVTKPISFKGTANLSDANVLKIKADTTLTYGDFGIAVPNFSFLANVGKTVKLSVELVAK